MKIKLMILMILAGLIAIPGILAEPDKEKYDMAITDYCYYEWTDYWGTSGIAVNVTYANKGKEAIPYPRLDTFQNDAVFTREKYGDLIHGSAIRFAPLEPGEEFEQIALFFPFYAYYPGSERGQLINARIYVDWPNEVKEYNENNNFVELDLLIEHGTYKKCKSNKGIKDDTAINDKDKNKDKKEKKALKKEKVKKNKKTKQPVKVKNAK